MTRIHMVLIAGGLLVNFTACDDGLGKGDDTSITDDTQTGTAGWTVSTHPCGGNRTDTLWVDEPNTAWVGCGTTTEGRGLYTTSDGGGSWAAASTQPNGVLETWRVNSVHRSADGLLYVAGRDTGGADRVLSLDTSTSPATAAIVFTAGNQSWNSFDVGSFQRNGDGFSVAESSTGSGLAYRTSDSEEFQDGSGWATDGQSYQMLDITQHNDDFYGCGSTISEPHHVFLPSDGAGFQLQPVQLTNSGFEVTGELWGIDVDDAGITAGGVDQDRDVGMVYSSRDDPTDGGNWKAYDVSELLGSDDATWIRGVCRGAGKVVAVGEFSQSDAGIVLVSTDNGETFSDMSPADGAAPALHRCHVLSDGAVFVAGAGGWFGALR